MYLQPRLRPGSRWEPNALPQGPLLDSRGRLAAKGKGGNREIGKAEMEETERGIEKGKRGEWNERKEGE